MGKEQEMKYNQRLRDLEMKEIIDKFQNQPLCHSKETNYNRNFNPEKLLKLKPNPLETNITDLGEVLKEIGSEPRMAEVDLTKIPTFQNKVDQIEVELEKREKGLRYDKGKVRYDLLEPFAMEQLALVFTKGAMKYDANNWLKGMNWSKMRASLGRHLAAYDKNEDFDFDPTCTDCQAGKCVNHTGLYHMAQVAWNALGILSYYKHFPQGDDRFKKPIRKIGLDIDEVICDWVNPWCEKFGLERPKTWFFQRDINKHFKEMTESGELSDFYLTLKPLMRAEEIPFEPHCYVTSRPVPTDVTEKWLDMNGFPTRPVITVAPGMSKVQALKEAGVEVFVDDRYENYEELNRNGILCYLWDSPHNQRYNVGFKRIKTLKELI